MFSTTLLPTGLSTAWTRRTSSCYCHLHTRLCQPRPCLVSSIAGIVFVYLHVLSTVSASASCTPKPEGTQVRGFLGRFCRPAPHSGCRGVCLPWYPVFGFACCLEGCPLSFRHSNGVATSYLPAFVRRTLHYMHLLTHINWRTGIVGCGCGAACFV